MASFAESGAPTTSDAEFASAPLGSDNVSTGTPSTLLPMENAVNTAGVSRRVTGGENSEPQVNDKSGQKAAEHIVCSTCGSLSMDLVCPLSLSIFRNPVFADDGHTYSRAWITRHLETGAGTSPLTREKISKRLVRNKRAEQQVKVYREHVGRQLISAVENKNGQKALELLESGTPDLCVKRPSDGRTAFLIAASLGLVDLVNTFIELCSKPGDHANEDDISLLYDEAPNILDACDDHGHKAEDLFPVLKAKRLEKERLLSEKMEAMVLKHVSSSRGGLNTDPSELLTQLKDPMHVAKLNEKYSTVEQHCGVECDVCEMSPIVGKRYFKVGSDDYDLCEAHFEAILSDKKKAKFKLMPADSPFLCAITAGNVEDAMTYIVNGVNVLEKCAYGHTVLHVIAEHLSGYPHAVDLVELVLACPNGSSLLNAKTASGQTPLIAASDKMDTALVRCLLDNGADVRIRDMNGDVALSFGMCMGPSVPTTKIESSKWDNIEVVKLLLDAPRGMEVLDSRNNGGITALMEAAINDRPKIARFLLARGANYTCADDHGYSKFFNTSL